MGGISFGGVGERQGAARVIAYKGFTETCNDFAVDLALGAEKRVGRVQDEGVITGKDLSARAEIAAAETRVNYGSSNSSFITAASTSYSILLGGWVQVIKAGDGDATSQGPGDDMTGLVRRERRPSYCFCLLLLADNSKEGQPRRQEQQ